jgi:hypothetical protein
MPIVQVSIFSNCCSSAAFDKSLTLPGIVKCLKQELVYVTSHSAFQAGFLSRILDCLVPPCRSESEKRKKGPAGTTGVPAVLRKAYFGSRDDPVAPNQPAVYSGRHGGLVSECLFTLTLSSFKHPYVLIILQGKKRVFLARWKTNSTAGGVTILVNASKNNFDFYLDPCIHVK